jgi:hypothetical protein
MTMYERRFSKNNTAVVLNKVLSVKCLDEYCFRTRQSTNTMTEGIHKNTKISWAAIGLFIVFCTPLVAAGTLYAFRDSFHFKHLCKGNLYNPPIDSKALTFYDPSYLGKWQLIDIRFTPNDKTVLSNAIYTALGKDRERVTQRHLSTIPLQSGSMMIIDPAGWLVVHYPPGTDPKGILNNFRRLLRLSYVK